MSSTIQSNIPSREQVADKAAANTSTSTNTNINTNRTHYTIYDTPILNIYDYFVLGTSFTYFWKCPADQYLLPFFRAHFSRDHLDMGVGTGYFPATALAALRDGAATVTTAGAGSGYHPSQHESRAQPQRITLWDLSSSALAKTWARLEAADPDVHISIVRQDARSLPKADRDDAANKMKFDSISASLLFHCVPGPCEEKSRLIFRTARTVLRKDGLFTGSTILGSTRRIESRPAETADWMSGGDAEASVFGAAGEQRMACPEFGWVGKMLMYAYNYKGIFSNWDDEPDVIVAALEKEFAHVETWIVGRVLLWRATGPRDD